jgi:D-beta-D-heptose 7-phosphate kinase/D-beta-D-heptose 1-phosphate adenosyltransferase
MNVLEEFLKLDIEGPAINVGVVGDAMVDEYFNVRVKKISPEFPIPVMHSNTDESEDYPGGAANVAYQFKHFNVKAKLIAFTDADADAAFKNKGVNTELCVNIGNKIPRKRRFYSDDFPTYRWDVEQANYGLADIDKKCFELYERAQSAEAFNVMIFSDYNKGVMSKYVDLLIPEVPISVVDPKTGDLDRWRGCTVFKPNAQEALALTGCSSVLDAGMMLLDRLKCEAVIITQAGKGVTVFDHYSPTFGVHDDGGVYEIRPTEKLPPAESVIGAGDCFTAFLAMALARGMGIRAAAEVAWRMGVLYVRNRHNKPLGRDDVMKSFNPAASKIIVGCPEDCLGRNYPPYKRDYKLVFANGCFDVLHSGHLATLRFAKSCGDRLVVAVNSDESVAQLKPGRPFVKLEDRMEMLASLEFVDYVVPFFEKTPLEIIKRIKPDVIVKGAEYEKEKIVGYGLAEVVTAPMVEGLSTTGLIEKIKATD